MNERDIDDMEDIIDPLLMRKRSGKYIAQMLVRSGYRKPRTITTAEELEDMPAGSVIKDRDRDVCQRFRIGWRAMIHEDHGDPWLTDAMEIDLPATVLHEGSQP